MARLGKLKVPSENFGCVGKRLDTRYDIYIFWLDWSVGKLGFCQNSSC